MNKDEYYLEIAKAVSKKSSCLKKHYGAIIVKNDRICSTGYNGAPAHEPHCVICTKKSIRKDETAYMSCKSVHAEMNCIISASKEEMLGAALYLAGFDIELNTWIEAEPCEICLRLIKNAGIAQVINNSGIIYRRNSNGILEKVRKDN